MWNQAKSAPFGNPSPIMATSPEVESGKAPVRVNRALHTVGTNSYAKISPIGSTCSTPTSF
jgi:hypothetical protein